MKHIRNTELLLLKELLAMHRCNILHNNNSSNSTVNSR